MDRQLDNLLRLARWPEMSQDATARLRDMLRTTRQPNKTAWLGWAAAAAVLLVLGLAALLTRHRAPLAPLAARNDVMPTEPVLNQVRPPTTYERVLIAACERSESQRAAAVQHSNPPKAQGVADNRAAVDLLLKRILNARTRDGALAALRADANPPVDALIAKLDSPLVEQRFAAAKALGSLCHGQTLDELKRMVAQNDHRREALAALICCANPSAGQFLDSAKRQPAIRAQLIAVQGEMHSLF